jgi:hypothetical protein
MPTAFKWAYANWDNAEPFIPSEAQNGRRSGDGDHALAAREPRFSGDLEGTLLLFRIALHRMSYTDLGVSSPAPPARAAAAPLPFSPGWQQPTPQPQVRHPSVHQAVSPLHQPQTPSRSAPDPYPHTARGYLHGRKLGPQSISQDRLVSKAAMALSRSRAARTTVMSCCASRLTTSNPIPRAPPVRPLPEPVETQSLPLQRHPPRKAQGHGRPRKRRRENGPEQLRRFEPDPRPRPTPRPEKHVEGASRTALEVPILHELIAKHVYVVRSAGGLQAGDDFGDGRVGVGHAFCQGAPDLVDELAGGRGVCVEHLQQAIPAHAVRLDPRGRFDASGGEPASVWRSVKGEDVGDAQATDAPSDGDDEGHRLRTPVTDSGYGLRRKTLF